VRDILWLRLLSILAGIALVPYFLYGEAQVLWVPMAWNGVFTLINLVQVYRLLTERRPVRLTEFERRLHESGEMSFLTGEPTSASAWADGITVYAAWPCSALRDFFATSPEVHSGMQLILGHDLAHKLRGGPAEN